MFTQADFMGMTPHNKYSYTKKLPDGGFTFEFFATKQHPEPLSEMIKYVIRKNPSEFKAIDMVFKEV